MHHRLPYILLFARFTSRYPILNVDEQGDDYIRDIKYHAVRLSLSAEAAANVSTTSRYKAFSYENSLRTALYALRL